MFIEVQKLSKIYKEYFAVNKINFKIEKNKTLVCSARMVVEKLQLLVCYLDL